MNLMQKRRFNKAIVLLFLFLFLFVSSSIFFTYMILNNNMKSQLDRTNIELLRQLNQKLELVFEQVDTSAIQLLQAKEVVRFFDREMNEQDRLQNDIQINNMISNIISSNRSILSIDLYSYNNKRLVSGNIVDQQDLINDYQWISEFLQCDCYLKWMTTRPIMLSKTNYPIYRNVVTSVRAYPLLHTLGARKGTIAVNMKEEKLYELIENMEGVMGGHTYIIDNEGVVVAHEDKGKIGKDISEMPYIKRIMDDLQTEGTFTDMVDEIESSFYYYDTARVDWTIVRIIPENQLNKPLYILRNALLMLAVVLFIVAALSVLYTGHWMFKPVNRFIQAMLNRLIRESKNPTVRKYKDEFQYFESSVQRIMEDRELLNKQVNESKASVKLQLIRELLTYHHNPSTIMSHMDQLGMNLDGSQYVVMSVEFDNKQLIHSSRDLQLYSYALSNVAEELMNAESYGIASEMDNGKCVVIMSFSDDDDINRHMMRAIAVADLMKDFVKEFFSRTITVGIGNAVDRLSDIPTSYKQSLDALSYKLVMGEDLIITQEDIENDSSPQFHRLFAMTEGMTASVNLLEHDRMRMQVHTWFEAFVEYNIPPDMIMQLIVQCLMKVAVAATDIGVDVEGIFPQHGLHEILGQYEQLEQLELFMVNSLDQCMDRIKDKRSQRERNSIIDHVLQYIHEHYMRSDLSLNLLASEFHISVSHLSKLFKEHIESNFIDYLIEVRMNKAKELLMDTESMIKDISECVGYTNVNSFARLFRKMTGLTPSEYRQHKYHSES